MGTNSHGLTTGIESRGTNGCKEQWNVRDTRVLIGLGLLADKNPMPMLRWCIMIAWVENPSTPPIIG
jgi:hypothetical protein